MNMIKRVRVSRREWYDTYGGFANSNCFRRADNTGAWTYWVLL